MAGYCGVCVCVLFVFPAKGLRLSDEVLRHRIAKCSFEVACIGTKLQLTAYIFCRARTCNQRCFWPLKEIYEACKCDVFSGQASKWYFNMQASWMALFYKAFG